MAIGGTYPACNRAPLHDPDCRHGRTCHSLLYRQSHWDGKALPLPWLERIALASLWLILLLWLVLPTQWVIGIQMFPLYIVAAGAHLYRQLRWRPGTTVAQPLLWSLHLAYLFIPLGLTALAARTAGWPIALSLASHLFSAGSMGP